MLTSRQLMLIQESYMKMSLQLASVGQRFYVHLFRLHPELEAMFKGSMSAQSMKLMQTIGFAVSQIHSPETFRPVVAALGERHVHYGVTPKHYEYLGEALILMLEEMLGDGFTAEVKEAWTHLYADLVSTATGHLQDRTT